MAPRRKQPVVVAQEPFVIENEALGDLTDVEEALLAKLKLLKDVQVC
jgi:hypothetical protein